MSPKYAMSFIDSSNLAIDDLIASNTLSYLQFQLRRSYSLLLGCCESIGNRNILSSVLTIRAHIEVTGAIGYLLRNLNRYYSEKMTKEELENLLNKLILGRRMGEMRVPFEAVNVLTMIKKSDLLINKMLNEEKKNILFDCYEWLSEFCHTNSYGLISGSTVREPRVLQLSDKITTSKKDSSNVKYISITMPLFFLFFEEIFSIIIKNENLPKFKKCTNENYLHRVL
ncbi:MAG: hypothetical protein HQ557_15490 [Bacteroidetes bacterium]|nr:hypothetical protein [Bacteroidota bacterium]